MILSCTHNYENGSGRRKRCPECAAAKKKEQVKDACRLRHIKNYVRKRGVKI